MGQSVYIHGTDENYEHQRLESQALLIKKFIWKDLSLKDFQLANELPFLEVGCGVAAQTVDLLDALPSEAHIIGIDVNPNQIVRANEKMKAGWKYISGRKPQ